MKRKSIRLSRRYSSALRQHLKQGPRASLQSARGLGRRAVSLGLEILDVAKIHDRALASLKDPSLRIVKRAELFFIEAVTPIENTHRAALKTDARLNQVTKALGQRTVDLAAANRSLKQGMARRKTVDKALKASDGQSKKLLEESSRLQKRSRNLAHGILSTQEENRKTISNRLQDDVTQTLLGINVRLLAIKQKAIASAMGIHKEIADTLGVVDQSIKNIRNFAREFSESHEK